jgi:hypothetical protein
MRAAGQWETYANTMSRLSAGLAGVPGGLGAGMAVQYKDEADGARQTAKQYREFGLQQQKLTDPEQQARREGLPGPLAASRQEAIDKATVARSTTVYSGIQGQSEQYERDLKHMVDLSRSLLNQPGVYTGAGGDLSLMVNRVKAFFGDHDAAVLQEALQKVTAASVLGQINNQRSQLAEAGEKAGRIFQQQVELVGKASPQLATTVGGNLFLVNVTQRLGDMSSQIAAKARAYVNKIDSTTGRPHGVLDAGFDDQIARYLNEHPVFTPQELANPKLLGSHDVPESAGASKQALGSWFNAMGLKPGDTYRLPDGRYREVRRPER